MANILVFWLTAKFENTIKEAGAIGDSGGRSLHSKVLQSGIELRILTEWFELIDEETDNSGLGWGEFFGDEDSKEEIEFNQMMDDGLFLLRNKECVFLATAWTLSRGRVGKVDLRHDSIAHFQ
jgi:hypothetical protein